MKRKAEPSEDQEHPSKKAKTPKGILLIDTDGTVFGGFIADDLKQAQLNTNSSQEELRAVILNRELIGNPEQWQANLAQLVKHYEIYFISRNDEKYTPLIAQAMKQKMGLDDDVFRQLHFDCEAPTGLHDKRGHIKRALAGRNLPAAYYDDMEKEIDSICLDGILLRESCVDVKWKEVAGELDPANVEKHFGEIDKARQTLQGDFSEASIMRHNQQIYAQKEAERAERKKADAAAQQPKPEVKIDKMQTDTGTGKVSDLTFANDPQSTGSPKLELPKLEIDSSLQVTGLPPETPAPPGNKGARRGFGKY